MADEPRSLRNLREDIAHAHEMLRRARRDGIVRADSALAQAAR